MSGERSWNKHKAQYKGRDYTMQGLKTGHEYEIAYRFTPENYIEVAVNHPGTSNRTYQTLKEFGKHWRIEA